ncbi:MAG: class I SAM-dependent methyltransferase [Pseudomonadota bacterium]
MNFYQTDSLSALQAKFEAQKIAFGPIAFQATLALRDLGVLAAIEKHGKSGVAAADIAAELGLSEYGVKVLAEAGLGMGLLLWNEEVRTFSTTKVAYFVLHDPMTRANMDFVQDINYRGFLHLQEAITSGRPAGLQTLGNWPTLYEGLAHLEPKAQKSWLTFDHFHSDAAFSAALRHVFRHKPRQLLDVGGNTGRWTLQCLAYDSAVQVTIADLPGQLAMAKANLAASEHADRIGYYAVNLLDQADALPTQHDAIWMSQFLDCFSESEIVTILQRAASVMGPQDNLFILEAFWDRQQYPAAAYCLQQTSLYFTCIANGNSQMYHSGNMKECLAKAGLVVVEDIDSLGISHTLFRCQKPA